MNVRTVTPGTPVAASTPAPAAAGDLPPYMQPDVVAQRNEQGRVAEYQTGTLHPGIGQAAAPSYFRTVSQVHSAMRDLAAKYPNLVEVVDLGDSGEKSRGTADRDILGLRLTNKAANAGKKAGAFFIAGEHAREIANPELMMRFATQLLDGYGRDAEATAMLDTRDLMLVPIMNPDGHVVVEKGFSRESGGNLMHRKNTTPPSGVDLNRNYEFHWGGAGASSSPGSDTYRGASAASEPEVQAIQKAVTAMKPGIFIDWHSYSQLNLYSWGDTRDPAPDHVALDALAKKFSTWNHYTPEPAIELYPTSGTSKDYVYGTHHIPAFTIETGRTFHQSDKEFEQVWGENAPVMQYAVKVADAPLKRVFGPDTLDVLVTAQAPGLKSGEAKITAQIDDPDKVAGAEWTKDPFAAPGTGTPLTAADGAFDGAREVVTGTAPVPTQAGVRELVYVRARDTKGNWGALTPQWIAQ